MLLVPEPDQGTADLFEIFFTSRPPCFFQPQKKTRTTNRRSLKNENTWSDRATAVLQRAFPG